MLSRIQPDALEMKLLIILICSGSQDPRLVTVALVQHDACHTSNIANKQVSHSIAWQSHRNNLYLLACGDGFGIEDMNVSLRQLHGVNDLSCFISRVNL